MEHHHHHHHHVNHREDQPPPPAPGNNQDRPQAGLRRSECLVNSFYTGSYLIFELLVFVALLSLSIGSATLIAFAKEYFWTQKMSIFLQTYITLWVLHNLSYFQARHQLIYVYPLRARFGNQSQFCFKCVKGQDSQFIKCLLI